MTEAPRKKTVFDPMAHYLREIERINQLPMGPEKEWIFHSGMLFMSDLKWWTKGKRATCHEGLDIFLYRDRSGDIAELSPSVRIPAMTDGIILNICDDFLGKSVIVASLSIPETGKADDGHAKESMDEKRAIVYSHISVESHLHIGQRINTGEILGRVADTSMRKNGIGSHLHISFMIISRSIDPTLLNWQLFTRKNQDAITFFNPMPISPKPLLDADLDIFLKK